MNQRFPCLGIDYYLNRILRFENWRAPVVPTLSKSFCAPPSNDNFIHPFHTNNATAICLFLPFVIFHLPREGSMKLCFGCNQSFFRISKHWHHNSTCRSAHHERAQFVAAQQQSMLTNELSEGDDSSSERRSKSLGSESESDVSLPTNLDTNGVLGAIILGPNKRPANSTSNSLSSSSSAKTKGTYQHRTTLGDGRVVETRVSVRNQNKLVSKRQRTEQLNVEEDDEVHHERDDMSSLLDASAGIMSFQDDTQHDDGYADNWDDGAEADDEAVMSFAATHGGANQHQHNLPPNLSSCDPPPLWTYLSRLLLVQRPSFWSQSATSGG